MPERGESRGPGTCLRLLGRVRVRLGEAEQADDAANHDCGERNESQGGSTSQNTVSKAHP
jgi:hypothetical protein